MADRANFGLRQTDGNIIFVYGHWAGYGMLSQFANALNRASLSFSIPDDPPYANRIIISQLIGDDWNQDIGWGISTQLSHHFDRSIVPVYDFATDEVGLYDHSWSPSVLTDKIVSFTREEFISKYAKSKIGV